MKRGDRVIVTQRLDLERGGWPVRHAGKMGTVCKCNGSMVLVDIDNEGAAWVRRKWLRLERECTSATP